MICILLVPFLLLNNMLNNVWKERQLKTCDKSSYAASNVCMQTISMSFRNPVEGLAEKRQWRNQTSI